MTQDTDTNLAERFFKAKEALGTQMNAFLLPASVTFLDEILLLNFPKGCRFHYEQVLSRRKELSARLLDLLGRPCELAVFYDSKRELAEHEEPYDLYKYRTKNITLEDGTSVQCIEGGFTLLNRSSKDLIQVAERDVSKLRDYLIELTEKNELRKKTSIKEK